MDDRTGKLTDILKPLTNDADRKLVLERASRDRLDPDGNLTAVFCMTALPDLSPPQTTGLFCVNGIAVAKSKTEAGASMTDPHDEREAREARVRPVAEIRAPVKPAAVAAVALA